MNPYNPYGQQQQQQQQQYGQQPVQPQQQRAEPQPLSMTDSILNAEDTSINWEVDANASMPTVLPSEFVFGNADQGYLCSVSFADPTKTWMKDRTSDGREYIYAILNLTIEGCQQNPAMNGRKIRFIAKTLTQRNGVTQAMALIQGAGLQGELLNRPRTAQTQIDFINRIINTGIRVYATVDWEASFWDKATKQNKAPERRGWRNFPLMPNGEPMNELTIASAQGTPLHAYARTNVRFVKPQASAGNAPMPVANQPMQFAPQQQFAPPVPQQQFAPQPQQFAPAPAPVYQPQQQQFQQPQQQQFQPAPVHPAYQAAPTGMPQPPLPPGFRPPNS